MEVKSVALYLRLSREDEAARGQLKDESNSIHSQRLLLRQYVKEHQELASLPLREFVDDGYTGTNFDRPQFQQMMALVKAGEVECILVKDLSRFGRNYLEVGDYLEHIFPFLGVRFIAVNDHFDSQEYVGKTTGMEVAFRNLVYQRYSQDLSEKVKSAMHLKMSKGKYVTSCPYGYRKDPADKHHMVIDPETAPIVREIFLAAIAGKKTTEIAAVLNERQIPTPQMHKKTREEKRHSAPMWSHQAVLRILQNYKYTGAMVNFKVENATIRAKIKKKNCFERLPHAHIYPMRPDRLVYGNMLDRHTVYAAGRRPPHRPVFSVDVPYLRDGFRHRPLLSHDKASEHPAQRLSLHDLFFCRGICDRLPPALFRGVPLGLQRMPLSGKRPHPSGLWAGMVWRRSVF